MNPSRLFITFALSGLLSVGAQAVESDNKLTPGMIITGDQELPQVLYIQPWKPQTPAIPATPERRSQLQQPLTPCESGQPLTDFQQQLWDCSQPKQSQP